MKTATKAKGLEVRPISGSLGAEIRGISLDAATAADADDIRALLFEHLVLLFPDQALDPDQHIAFGKLFGKLDSHPNLAFGGERPEFFELHAEGGQGAIADEWHSDLSCEDEPSIMSILHMVKSPSVGGDTMWANMYKAYEELSPAMKEFCEGLTALHDADPHGRADRIAIHPVVRVHPETGRKSLFVNEHFTRRIVELSHEESKSVLGYLTRWVTSPSFTVRYSWREGTIAIWDNRCTQHYVLNDFEGERIIQRVTVMGDKPEAASPPRWEPFIAGLSATSRHDRQLIGYLKARDGEK
jgi:taurine dioxygenase